MVIEREWSPKEMNMDVYLLDAGEFPLLSEKVSADFNVPPQDLPQALIIEKGKPVFFASYGKIDYRTLRNFANRNSV
jgi:hypothetical protein